MNAVQVRDKYIQALESYNEHLVTHGNPGFFSYVFKSASDDMAVLSITYNPHDPSSLDSGLSIVPFICFVFEEQIIFQFMPATIKDSSLLFDAFRFINEVNKDYQDFKVLLQKDDNGLYNIEIRHYIDLEDIIDDYRLGYHTFCYARNLDRCFAEYKKGWQMFV